MSALYENETLSVGWIEAVVNSLSQKESITSHSWLCATFCSALVGLSGLFPILLLPNQDENGNETKKKTSASAPTSHLRFLLSFAVGGLIGDVFLHLLPEARQQLRESVLRGETDWHSGQMSLGLWILAGLLTFVVVEIMFCIDRDLTENSGGIQVGGYLNLIANCIDNFSHGLAVGGAFLVSTKMGFVTTGCILLHEIPHEVGDFAILIKSGFSRMEAAKAQFWTASLGMSGAMLALVLDSFVAVDSFTSWIIPFTSGGFINIALVTVLPDILSETKTWKDGFQSISGTLLGVALMMLISKI
jgi:solute carrier family 39 (zinc transporter), member 13